MPTNGKSNQGITMTRTHHWLIAILMTSTLLCIGIIFTLLNQKQGTPKNVSASNSLPNVAQTQALAMPVSSQTLTEALAKQKAQQLLPVDNIESVKKVNYEGKLAYQINTNQNALYLNATTSDVLAITPRLDNKPKMVQVSYEQPRYHEHEEDEHDDD